MAWFFHVVELLDGGWVCRHGLETYDRHEDPGEAIEHCKVIAANNRPSEVLLHRFGSEVQRIAALE